MRNRYLQIIGTALAVVMTLGLGSVVAYAADTTTRVSLELSDVPVQAAIQALFRGTGKNFTIDPAVTGTIPSISIKDVSFDSALKSLCKTAGLTYRLDTDNIYLIQKKQTVTETAPVDTSATAAVEVQDTATEETVLDKVPLAYTGARPNFYDV